MLCFAMLLVFSYDMEEGRGGGVHFLKYICGGGGEGAEENAMEK